MPHAPITVYTFLLYSVVDIAINTSAGAAAAAAGAHANGSVNHRAVQLGALAGLLKSAWHSAMSVVGWAHVHWLYDLAVIAVTNDFAFAELLVVVLAAISLGHGKFTARSPIRDFRCALTSEQSLRASASPLFQLQSHSTLSSCIMSLVFSPFSLTSS
jgi:hypothetical protein